MDRKPEVVLGDCVLNVPEGEPAADASEIVLSMLCSERGRKLLSAAICAAVKLISGPDQNAVVTIEAILEVEQDEAKAAALHKRATNNRTAERVALCCTIGVTAGQLAGGVQGTALVSKSATSL